MFVFCYANLTRASGSNVLDTKEEKEGFSAIQIFIALGKKAKCLECCSNKLLLDITNHNVLIDIL